MSRKDNHREGKQMNGFQGLRSGGLFFFLIANWEIMAKENGVSFRDSENVLGLDSGNGCTTLQIW